MEKVKTKIYLMEDSHGNRTAAVVEDSSSSAMVCGMHGRENELLHFESDAYHLPNWCSEHNIELRVITRDETFAHLWDESQTYNAGDSVVYIPNHARGHHRHPAIEYGTVKRVEGIGRDALVWVTYGNGDTGQLTLLSNLFKR